MDSLVQRAQARTRFAFILISVFAVIATLLAGIGLYGLLSSVVSQRIAEIGIRVAMGASPSDIQRLIVGYGMRLGLAGLAIGLPSALWAVLLASDIFFGIKPTDPSTFGFMVAIFLLVAAVASWFPARRAARMDPLRALSED
jgi:putative ABC transport system permease protein